MKTCDNCQTEAICTDGKFCYEKHCEDLAEEREAMISKLMRQGESEYQQAADYCAERQCGGTRPMKQELDNKRPSRCIARLVRLDSERYRTEKVEAYNVAIDALRNHESADPDPDGLDTMLREKLADKLDAEIQRWYNSLPNDLALATRGLESAPEKHAGDGQPSGLPAAHGSASSLQSPNPQKP